ncbi:MAG: ribosome silencing factor [Clostridia bacterium]|nr:ribosome silencing factor [Clostridia bacterium]
MQDQAVAQAVAGVLWEHKAQNIIVLDVRHLTSIADYMVIASGRNANQVKALADFVDDKMAELGQTPIRTEGMNDGHWCIMEYDSCLVELFHQEEREFYRLERLWEDGANRVPLPFDQTKE